MSKIPSLINKQVGKYQILNEISRGGMGIIYLGKHSTLNRYAAVKMLFPHLASESRFVKRFREEMNAMSKLRHRNIVDIYDYEEAFDTYFIIMEVVVGRPLDSMLKETGPMPQEIAARIIRQVLSALECAHEKGILHRDIKPSNIMINDQGHAKVLDFGIAKIMGSENLTQTGFMVGTPMYLSPEQAQGQSPTQASDIYSVSVVLYEMVTGQTPFQGENPVSLAMAHIKEPPPKPKKINENISTPFDKLILKGLEKEPSKRFKSARAMIAALDKIVPPGSEIREQKSTPRTTPPPIPIPVDGDTDDTALMEEVRKTKQQVITDEIPIQVFEETPAKPRKKFKMGLPLLVGALIIVWALALGTWMMFSSRGQVISTDLVSSTKSMFEDESGGKDPSVPESAFAIPVEPVQQYGNIFGIQMEIIPSGVFTMGAKRGSTGALDDSPDHEVELDTYLISRYEITNEQFSRFLRDTGYRPPPQYDEIAAQDASGQLPVVNVSWFDANNFCKWLAQKTGLYVRLPTEAEWERAAYSGLRFSWGEKYQANAANTSESSRKSTAPVGSFSDDRSLAGIYDVGGNVQEWTADNYSMSAYGVAKYNNPKGPSSGKKRVVRGGSYLMDYKSARITRRDCFNPMRYRPDLGFRIVIQATKGQ